MYNVEQIDANKLYSVRSLPEEALQLRQDAVNDLETFVRLVAPFQIIGHCHRDLCRWIMENEEENKLILWPRDHNKSRYAAFYTLWKIVRQPDITVIYASVTTTKAAEMLQFIQGIMDSAVFRRYFPELIHKDRNKRKKWTTETMVVDHPLRAERGVIDPTIFTAGIGTKLTGKHADLIVFDDIVVYENSVREGDAGRENVQRWISQAASIASMSGQSTRMVVGTRYHPKDAYSIMMSAEYPIYDDEGVELEVRSLYKVNQANTEVDGVFLWPRQRGHDNKWYGMDRNILARKKAEYMANGEITQFYAQYYNDPNNRETAPISRELFKYYNKEEVEENSGFYYANNKMLYVYASIDMASSVHDRRDYTVITVVGIDELANRYILHIDRFRTDKTSEIKEKLLHCYSKYNFRALRIEAVSGFKLVANDIKINLEESGVSAPIELYIPTSHEAKLVRINGILEPLYKCGHIWHFKGGNCELLENELVAMHSEHDDLKDSLATCCDPSFMKRPISFNNQRRSTNVIQYHPRFGGVR